MAECPRVGPWSQEGRARSSRFQRTHFCTYGASPCIRGGVVLRCAQLCISEPLALD